MNIPNFVDAKVVDKDGYLTDIWKQIFSQLIDQMQQNLSNEGHFMPKQDTATVTALNTSKSVGAILFDSSTGKFMANEAGIFKTIQTL